jgi:hypothetical protein
MYLKPTWVEPSKYSPLNLVDDIFFAILAPNDIQELGVAADDDYAHAEYSN